MVHDYSNNHEITDLHPQIGVRTVTERVTAKRLGLTVRGVPFPECLGQGPALAVTWSRLSEWM